MRSLTLRSSLFTLLAAACLLTACTPIAEVRQRKPNFMPTAEVEPSTLTRLREAARSLRTKPEVSLANLLQVAHDNWRQLERNPSDSAALEAYNLAVSRVMTLMHSEKLQPWRQPVTVTVDGKPMVFSWKKDPRPGWYPGLYRFEPADEFDVRGRFVKDRAKKPGIGAPIVAIGRDTNNPADDRFALPRTFYGVTALIRFTPGQAVISFEDPLATEDVRVGRAKLSLAADFTVPVAVMLQSANVQKLGIRRMLFPERYVETARLIRLEPYDPKKAIVLVIHGLMDTPATWTPLVNSLRMDPSIRKNYQFWFFSYPSGWPYPRSAAVLREQLDAAVKEFRIRRPIVVVGHSMGGCIARLMITDTGTRLWSQIFKKSPEDISWRPETRDLMKSALIFKTQPQIGRVLFLAAPLQGSDIASNLLGRIGSMLVRTPRDLLQAGNDVMDYLIEDSNDLPLRRISNSIDTLAPNNRFVRAINTLPMNPRIPVHVIAGDRGRGGNRDRTRPMMSDGVVPYWSSHIPAARSEKIVPSGHGVHQNPQAIAEVRRILIESALQK